ncbi:MAG TPA: T9SS type A sorting domain-containing protein [Puia sp.]|nr:T9SS type A sorting domain-containing protein [Puia sp.]
MKQFILFVAFSIFVKSTVLSQDLPHPPANLQTLPAGSYVIPMDNNNQLNASNLFNLKAYGLVVYLLNNNVKVKWVITAGKAKDGIDFTVMAKKIQPSSSGTASTSFISGPFVIYATDTTGVGSLITSFYSDNSLTGNNRPTVYKTTASVTVDIRYDLTGLQPKAGILTDGGMQSFHIAFMTAASIPATNYTTTSGSNLVSGCYTFASEPHNNNTGPAVDAAITSIKTFVNSGGNFLAECAAISNYENNVLGRFQTTTGITVKNANIGTTVSYPNPDLSFSQIHGAFNGSLTGSVENWEINGSSANNENNHATGTGANSSVIAASESKMVTGEGGLVFYLGNHNFTTADQQNINGIRMYMNAFLTPSPTTCGSVLAVNFMSFKAAMKNNTAQLEWEVAKQVNNKGFAVEHSIDGANWEPIGYVNGSNDHVGDTTYRFTDFNLAVGKNYYRLQQQDFDGHTSYSEIALVDFEGSSTSSVSLWPNPAKEQVNINLSVEESGNLQTRIFDLSGRVMLQMTLHAGLNTLTVGSLPRGIYVVHIIKSNGEIINQKLNKQ